VTAVACFIAGWVTCAATGALLLAAVIAEADRREQVAKEQQPAGVIDPETGAVWTETQRLDVRI
jgi:hypothetical protein